MRMKKYLFTAFLILIISTVFSQSLITLTEESFDINNRKFYVRNVIDKRQNKKFIGEIWKGTFKKSEKIDIAGGVENTFSKYFTKNFSKTSDDQIGADVFINYVQVKQSESYSKEIGEAYIILEFRSNNIRQFVARADIKEETDDAFSSHEERIRRGLKECVLQFNNTAKNAIYSGLEDYDDNALEIKFKEDKEINTERYKEKSYQNENRNIVAIGYQIGGYNLIGVDYEVRVHDYLGVHFGVGFLGYTAGIKIHTNEKTNSLFFNLSWKDAGLGLYNGLGIEAGGRWIWSKSRDFGLIYQAGFFIINHIDNDFKTVLYGTSEPPPVVFSMGVGLSW